MLRFAWIVGALALVGCKGDKDGTGDDSAEPACDITIPETFPYADQIDFYYMADLEVEFSAPDDATLILMDASGAEVTGTTTWNEIGDVAIFSPDGGLTPSTSYTLSVEYCKGTASIPFMTSSLGTTVDPVSQLDGKAFQIDLGSARFVEPEGIGSILESQLEQNILIGVVTASDTTVKMIGAISDADDADADGNIDEQDPCTPTIDFPEADFANPHFQVGPETTTISAGGIDVTIEDLEVAGDFASDGSYFGGGTLGGTVDTRPLAGLLDDTGNEAAICELVLELEYGECQVCPADGQPYCLTLYVDQIVANATATGLTELTEDTLPASCTE